MTTKDKEVVVPSAHVAPLISAFGVVRNVLSAPLCAGLAAGDRDAARVWWEARRPEEQYLLHAGLAALGAPMLIADWVHISGRERLSATRIVRASLRDEDPLWLVGTDAPRNEIRFRIVRDAVAMADTILFRLDLGIAIADPSIRLTLPARDLLVLLAAVDLEERRQGAYLADHALCPPMFVEADVRAAVADGFAHSGDPRWLLPFALQALGRATREPDAAAISAALQGLTKAGVLERRGVELIWTPAGKTVADTLRRRLAASSIASIAANPDGTLRAQSMLLLRGDGPLWFADIVGTEGPDTIMASASATLACELLLTALRPDVPPPPFAQTAPASVALSDKRPSARFCAACGAAVESGWRFCRACGARLQ